MYHVSVQGVDERMVNVHYYYYKVNGNIALNTSLPVHEYMHNK